MGRSQEGFSFRLSQGTGLGSRGNSESRGPEPEEWWARGGRLASPWSGHTGAGTCTLGNEQQWGPSLAAALAHN